MQNKSTILVCALIIGLVFLLGFWAIRPQSVSPEMSQRLRFPGSDPASDRRSNFNITNYVNTTVVKRINSLGKGVEPIAFVVSSENNEQVIYMGLTITVNSSASVSADVHSAIDLINSISKSANPRWEWQLDQLVVGAWVDGEDHSHHRHIMIRAVFPGEN